MKKHNEYILIASLFTIIMILLFRNFIFGENIFVSADTLAPQAIKQSIKNSLDSVPLWFPYIFSGPFINLSCYLKYIFSGHFNHLLGYW